MAACSVKTFKIGKSWMIKHNSKKVSKMWQIHHAILQSPKHLQIQATAHKSRAHFLYFLLISTAAASNSGLHGPASAMQAPASTARSAVPCRQPRPFQAAPRRSAGTCCAPTCVSLCFSLPKSALHGIAAHVQCRSGLICTSTLLKLQDAFTSESGREQRGTAGSRCEVEQGNYGLERHDKIIAATCLPEI